MKPQHSNRELTARKVWVLALVISVSSLILIDVFKDFGDWFGVRYDDAYITFRYAANFAGGNGLRFNSDSPTNSASAFLFTVLLGVIGFVFGSEDIPLGADVLNLFGMVLLVGCWLYWIISVSRSTIRTIVTIAFGVGVLCSGYFGYWTLSGMETVFSCGVLALAMLQIMRTKTSNASNTRYALLGTLSLLALSRPEFSVVALTLAVWYGLRGVTEIALPPKQIWFSWIPTCVVGTAVALLAFFYRFYYQSFVPDPAIFKSLVTYYERSFRQNTDSYVSFFGSIANPYLLIAVLLLFFLGQGPNVRKLWSVHSVPLLVAVSYTATLAFSPHADWYRYHLPLLVSLLFMTGSLGDLRASSKLFSFLSITAILILTFNTLNLSTQSSTFMKTIALNDKPVQEARKDAGIWLESNKSPGRTIWSTDIGAISYFNLSNHFFDGSGLTNRRILTALLDRSDYSAVICASQPDLIADTVVLADEVPSALWILDNLTSYYKSSVGASTTRLSTDLLTRNQIYLLSGDGRLGVGIYEINLTGCLNQ